jgi:6-pyruvoyltetrahydropterin/6-carboxytetrahydropterin synthase
MYYLEKKIQVSASHRLPHYDGLCANLHGHNWNITVTCRCKDDELNQQGMVIDFSEIKTIVNQLDHDDINKFIENPTAENIARWLADQIPYCWSIEVEETDGNKIIYHVEAKTEGSKASTQFESMNCSSCGAEMTKEGLGYTCLVCGFSGSSCSL